MNHNVDPRSALQVTSEFPQHSFVEEAQKEHEVQCLIHIGIDA